MSMDTHSYTKLIEKLDKQIGKHEEAVEALREQRDYFKSRRVAVK